MKKKIFFVYMTSIFVLFLAVGFIARQWYVGADPASTGGNIGFGDLNWLNTCSRCPTMNLICDDANFPENTTAGAYVNNCNLYMPVGACQLHNLSSRSNIAPRSLAGDLDCAADKINNSDDADQCCFLVHELGHICDPIPNGTRPQEMCTEVYAEQIEMLCRNVQFDKLCSKPGNEGICKEMCDVAIFRSAIKVWDACMCNEGANGTPSDGGTCCGCLNECKNLDRVKKLVPQTCISKGWINSDSLNSYCNEQSAANASHGCDYYNRGSYTYTQGSVGWIDNECEGGTNFDPSQCGQSLHNCYDPEWDESNTFLADNQCSSVFGSNFDLYSIFRLDPEGITHCPSPRLDMRVNFSCIKSSCNLGTTQAGFAAASSSSSTASRALTETANAGAPLAGVIIKAQKDRGPYSVTDNAVQTLGTSGADGKVMMNLLLGSWKITAEKDGYQKATQYVNVQKDTPFNLSFNMTPTGTQPPTPPITPPTPPVIADKTLKVVVRDAVLVSSSRPLNGATVKISKGDKTFTKTTAAPTGEAIFENLEAGTWNLEITKQGFALSPSSSANINIVNPLSEIHVAMQTANGYKAIKAIDLKSNPVPGVAVTFKQGATTKTKTTGADGIVTFDSLLGQGHWTVTGSKATYHQETPVEGESIGVFYPTEPLLNVPVDLVMDSGLRDLKVRTLVTNVLPLPNSRVEVVNSDGRLFAGSRSGNEVVFRNLPIGQYTITVTQDNYIVAPNQVMTVDLQSDTTKDVYLQLDIRNVTVRLKTTTGTNMANSQVRVVGDNGTISRTTGSDGTAVLSGVKRGQQTIVINKPGWVLAPNQVMSFVLQEDTTKDVVMERAGNYTFNVKGKFLRLPVPLSGATIKLCDKPLNDPSKVCRTQTTNLLGSFTFSNIAPRETHFYELKATNYQTKTGEISVAPGRTGSSTIQLNRTTAFYNAHKDLIVQLKTTTGTNFPNASVRISGPNGSITKTSDATGKAIFDDTSIGIWNMNATRSGWVLARGQEKTIDLQQSITKELKFQRAGSFKFLIKGRLLGASVILPRVEVKLCDKPISDNSRTCTARLTNATGYSTFTDYVPGIYYYEVEPYRHAPKSGTVTITKATIGNATVQLEEPQ